MPLGDFLASLDPFRQIGALVPEFSEDIKDRLNALGFDANEGIMLDWPDEPDEVKIADSEILYPGRQPQLDGRKRSARTDGTGQAPSHELHAVTPLRLVQIAGRFGWTPAYTHRRLARLAAIGLTLNYPDIELPDETVRWDDLLLLTKNFDGQPPAISGEIGQSYLERAAEEIFDAASDEVAGHASELRTRLNLYAGLFELEVTEN